MKHKSRLSLDAQLLSNLLDSLRDSTYMRDYSRSWSPKKLRQLMEIMQDPNFDEMLDLANARERQTINLIYIPELKEKLNIFFQRFPNVTKFVIRGYTPDFNDGDICEHTTSVEINGIESPCKDYYENRNNDSESWLFANMDILQRIYGTDWEFTALNQDGNITFVKEDYDCGY